MHTDADACGRTQGVHEHRKRLSAGSCLWEKNALPHYRDLILCQYCTWLFSQKPYQHSYSCQLYIYINYILKRKGKLSHLHLLFLVLLWGIHITLTQGSVIVCLCCCFSGSQPVKNIGDLGPVKTGIQFTGPSLTSVH